MSLSELRDLRAPIAVGALLRLLAWGAPRPLWMDEAISAVAATSPHPWEAIATTDLHPPAGVALLALMARLSHEELVLRLPSLLASVATIPMLARSARHWVGGAASVPAAWLIALCPPAVLYAGEARPYALGLLGVTAVLACADASNRVRALAAAAALSALWGAWPVVAAVAWVRRDRVLATTLAAAAVFATPLLIAQHAHQGADLAHGFLAPWFPPPQLTAWPGFFVHGAVALLGWCATATHSRRATVAGIALTILLIRRQPALITRLAMALTAGFLVLSAAAAYPWGATRHLIVLLPVLILMWTPTPRAAGVVFIAGLALLGATGPRLPRESVPEVLADLPAASNVVADASAAPGARWYGADLQELPWSAAPVTKACAMGVKRLLVAGEARIEATSSDPRVVALVRREGAALLDISQACEAP